MSLSLQDRRAAGLSSTRPLTPRRAAQEGALKRVRSVLQFSHLNDSPSSKCELPVASSDS